MSHRSAEHGQQTAHSPPCLLGAAACSRDALSPEALNIASYNTQQRAPSSLTGAFKQAIDDVRCVTAAVTSWLPAARQKRSAVSGGPVASCPAHCTPALLPSLLSWSELAGHLTTA
jgi:hypothetical protein